MSRSRVLYHMVRADFLERVRRYSFLLTLGFAVYIGYAVYAGQIRLQLDIYRGVSNSAWLGSVIGLVTAVFLTLIGFYVVKNAIQRDRQTRVGQILATTPMSKTFYALSNALSNFAALVAMVLILAVAALIIQLSRAEDRHIHFFVLLAPVLIFGLCALAVTAALAVFFESVPGLRGGVGNILYFFLWVGLVSMSATTLVQGRPITTARYFADYTGIATVMGQMQAQVHQLDPQYRGGSSFSVGSLHRTSKMFLWTGLRWNSAIVLSRCLWLAVAAGIAVLAGAFFDRFDPAHGRSQSRKGKTSGKPEVSEALGIQKTKTRLSVSHLTPLARTGSRMRFFSLVVAELRLMVRGQGWWWYVGAAGLFIACLASPPNDARSGVIIAAWLWPVLLWSQMGMRETQFSTQSLIFSAPRVFPRQLLAIWTAGVLVAALAGSGLGLHLLLARDFQGLEAWAAGALFIPAMALGTRRMHREPKTVRSFIHGVVVHWTAAPHSQTRLHGYDPRIEHSGTICRGMCVAVVGGVFLAENPAELRVTTAHRWCSGLKWKRGKGLKSTVDTPLRWNII
jgi:hypothetical protein